MKVTYRQAKAIRKRLQSAMRLTLAHAAAIHYTQLQPPRFDGIRLHRRSYRREYPTATDCSASTTWLIWDATLFLGQHLADFVNAEGWAWGYTGTQVRNGKRIAGRLSWLAGRFRIGDLVFYGDQGGGVPKHVAMYRGRGRVWSHGSEGGPYDLPIDYRSDRVQVRRYFWTR